MTFYDSKAPKKAVNLSINADMLGKARGLGVNLSAEMEARLTEIVRTAERERWVAEIVPRIVEKERTCGFRPNALNIV